MVPLKISLKNFLSYGKTTQHIDFQPYNLICLSGKNGHGKSALLDALTWVIWGHARKSGSGVRADESLIRLGQTQMMVSLEFISKGSVYRVRRELTLQGHKAQTALDIGILDAQTGVIRGLTEKTIRATQEKIIATIGLDYESFVNSVFLRQGSSNEFSKKSPKERKEILSSILGITQFELIKKRALEKSRLGLTQKETLLPIQQRLSCQIEQKEQLVHALADKLAQETRLQETQQQLHRALETTERSFQQYMHNKQLLQQTQHEQEKLQIRVEQSLHELRESRTEFRKILSKKITHRSVDSCHQERLEQELETMHVHELQRFELQQQALHLAQRLQSLTTELREAHTKKIHAVDLQIQQATLRISLHQKRAIELTEKGDVLNREIATKRRLCQTDVTLKKYEKYRELYQKFVAQKNSLRLQLNECDYRLKALSTQTIARCPTCTQELTSDKKIALLTLQQRHHRRAEHQLSRFSRLLPALKETIITMHTTIETRKELVHVEKQLAEVEREHAEMRNQQAQHAQIHDKAVHERLVLTAQQDTLINLDDRYQQLFQESEKIREKLTTIPEILPEKKRELIEQVKRNKRDKESSPEIINPLLQQIKKVVRVTIAHLKRMKIEQHELMHKVKELRDTTRQHESLDATVQDLRRNVQEHTTELNNVLRETGAYREQLARLELQEKEFARLTESIKQFSYEQELYQTIAQAVGKDGIQALLIEQALPEIEQEANELLGKLTDGQAHLFIESVRDLKSGKSKETLDIHISDATGVRAYELFSGGEAFRIDFALRIALSKLLARRAGTTLQTLIIDEGFGSQDEDGLAHIMEAIYKIQDDFAKIIIVSHLPYMKEHFPVHFVVSKTAQGSSIKVIEQG